MVLASSDKFKVWNLPESEVVGAYQASDDTACGDSNTRASRWEKVSNDAVGQRKVSTYLYPVIYIYMIIDHHVIITRS